MGHGRVVHQHGHDGNAAGQRAGEFEAHVVFFAVSLAVLDVGEPGGADDRHHGVTAFEVEIDRLGEH
jgi:hypothetical protein